MEGLTVAIITYNEELRIGKCLEAIRGFPAEILVIDSFSTDKTVEICESFGCRIIRRAFKGFPDQKQFAVNEAKNDWILILDADEEVTEELKNEIASRLQQEKIPYNGYEINFSLLYLGRIVRSSWFGCEHRIRLFNRNYGHFDSSFVHEQIKLEGPAGILKGVIIHHSYIDLHHHLEKLNKYTSLAAIQNDAKGIRYHKLWVPLKFPVSFVNSYFIKGTFRYGYPGFIWAFFTALYGAVKIAKTIELSEKT